MKTKNILILLFNSLFLLSCVSTIPQRNGIILPVPVPAPIVAAARLHAVILADIDDNKIGESTKVDFNHIKKLVNNIANNTGMKLAGYELTGNSLTNNNIRKIINNLPVSSNDAVIFYYAGHGKNTQTDTQWPSMILKDQNLEFNFVINKLQKKNPRFFLAIVDACNDFPNYNPDLITGLRDGWFDFSPLKKENYQNLFLRTKGYVVASGAKPGQLSWSDSKYGGLFTNQFLESLNRQLLSRTANWNTVMKQATTTIKLPKNVIQQPQYEIEIK
jgi:hypothetical protein